MHFHSLFSSHFYFSASGQAVVTGVVPSPPRFLPSICIAHRFQQPHCSSIFHRVLLTHALALSASQFVHKEKSPRIYTSMHSAGLELTKLTYTRFEDNLRRHRCDLSIYSHRCDLSIYSGSSRYARITQLQALESDMRSTNPQPSSPRCFVWQMLYDNRSDRHMFLLKFHKDRNSRVRNYICVLPHLCFSLFRSKRSFICRKGVRTPTNGILHWRRRLPIRGGQLRMGAV